MPKRKSSIPTQKPIEQYEHKDKQRVNNPPVGLVDSHTDNGGAKKKTYEYDPHLDPQLSFDHTNAELHEKAIERFQELKAKISELAKWFEDFGITLPEEEQTKTKAALDDLQNRQRQCFEIIESTESAHLPGLVWAGKAEHTSFEVPTVSLHVHERIDPRRIIESVRREKEVGVEAQPSLFETEKKPLREAIEFYKHKENWSNRLIAGDSLLVMNSLLEKEGMGGKVQMVYFDPPYGIKYRSNFQPFVNKKSVNATDKDDDLTTEPEMIKAFRDTWELGIHSYLTYLRDRLLLAKELLHESGSVVVQISDENVHRVRELMDEVFGVTNFCSLISFAKTSGLQSKLLYGICDYLIWYAKDINHIKYRQLYSDKIAGKAGAAKYSRIELVDGTRRTLTEEEKDGSVEIPTGAKFWVDDNLTSQGNPLIKFKVGEKTYQGTYKTTADGLEKLLGKNRIYEAENTIRFVRYLDDFPYVPLNSAWMDIGGIQSRTDPKIYVVQTANKAIQRCLLMTSDPGDLVLDITCGSGTTAFVAENWGRRWITCDTSRVAVALTKQRIMAGDFEYFELAHPSEGVGSGFRYKTVPHIKLETIANSEPPIQETIFDQPLTDSNKIRITGPFTVEAVPAPFAKSVDDINPEGEMDANASVARSGETLRQSEWIDRLRLGGVRGKGGGKIEFTRVEPIGGTYFLQADAETREDNPKRVVVCFGPEHAPLEQRMVEQAIEEARSLVPKPEIVLFCAFQFDPEARKDIDETNWPGMTFLEAQMDSDLQMDDLKKKPRDKDSTAFWLIGQPEVKPILLKDGKYQVEVLGFDYYNPKMGTVESGGKADIAMWMLDPDYDGRSLFPTQVFFPMAGDKEGWAKLAKNLKAEIDEEKIEAFRGTVSLPFTAGRKVAVKIIDARGIESLKIIHL